MLLLIPKIKLNLIIKRRMETSTIALEKPNTEAIPINTQPVIELVEPIQEPALGEAAATIPNTKITTWKDNINLLFEQLPLEKRTELEEKHAAFLANQGNETCDESLNTPRPPLFIAPDFSKEVLLTNVVYKSFVSQMDIINDKLNLEIKKSAELAHDWKVHLIALDSYIKSLESFPWKKALKYSACLLAVMTFLWKIGAYRAIPDFVAGHIFKNVSSVQQVVPKPNIENTIQTLTETPITPIGITMGIGTLTIGYGALYAIVFILRKLPK